MSRAVTLRELLILDAAAAAEQRRYPAVARLLRRADVSREDLSAASTDLMLHHYVSHALACLGRGDVEGALDEHVAATGLDRDEWIVETCRELGVELAEAPEAFDPEAPL